MKNKTELEKNVELLRQDVDELADLIRRLVDIVERNTDAIMLWWQHCFPHQVEKKPYDIWELKTLSTPTNVPRWDSYFRVDSKWLHFN